jgi:hypothetical protein
MLKQTANYESGIAHLLLLVLLAIGIAFGVYMVGQPTFFTPHASLSNPVVVERFGQAYQLTGNSYISIPNSGSLAPQREFTVEAWIKPDAPTSPQSMVIIQKNGSTVATTAYNLRYDARVNNDRTVTYHYAFQVAENRISCGFVTADSMNGTVNDAGGRPINGETVVADQVTRWKHIAGVLHNGNLFIYENGKLVAKNEFGLQSPCSGGSAPLTIGSNLYADNTYSNYFMGEIDEVRISPIARYTSDFNPQLSPFFDDGYVSALFHLDGNGNDSSRNNNYGTVIGGSFTESTVVDIPSPIPSPTPTPNPVTQIPVIGPIIAPIIAPSTPVNTPVSTPIVYPSPIVDPTPVSQPSSSRACPTGTKRTECTGYSGNGVNAYCWGDGNSYLGGICSSACTAYEQCSGGGSSNPKTPAPQPPISGNATCSAATVREECVGYSGNGINNYCWGNNGSYLGGTCKSSCPGYEGCSGGKTQQPPAVIGDPQTPSGCPTGTARKECTGYSGNGINAYCWSSNATYLGGICDSSCAAYDQCKK